MVTKNSKDLFDESTMSFGDHLEVLRVHLFKAIIGLAVGVALTLVLGDKLVAVIRSPIDDALRARGIQTQDDLGGFNLWDHFKATVTGVPIYDGSSQITDEGVKALQKLERLRQLDLSGTAVTSAGLKSLAANQPELTIERDALAVARLTDLAELGARCQLNSQHEPDSLAFSGPEFTDEHLSRLAEFKKLRMLDLRNSSITDAGLAALVPLTNLQLLNLAGTKITNTGLETLARLKTLKTLLISSPEIDDGAMASITSHSGLEELNLVGTRISDDGLDQLDQLKQLRSLSLSGNDITDKGLANLVRKSPQLTRLDLAGTRVSDAGISQLAGLQHLEILNLTRDTNATGLGGSETFASISEQASLVVRVRPSQLANVVQRAYPDQMARLQHDPDERRVPLQLAAGEFAVFRETADRMDKPITLNVQEAFMTYLKVALVGGIVFASPWIFYQVWLFVAAGLYPHEQKYVYIFLPCSLVLFMGGALFCFFLVFPFILHFLLGFNDWLEVTPQIRLSEWISFAVMLPLLFGVSFQLPLVMLFLERLSIFDATAYREKRRVATLVIAIISMLLTPADPASMLMMMMPLILLYELGIWLCRYMASRNPFQPETI
ncbi:MAG: twin-arginine translocase subunit TatC [Planctomycetaceae bacterium]|nr:twin-arginine translocase subunit TatC [Planctomycetaceae bacterium]